MGSAPNKYQVQEHQHIPALVPHETFQKTFELMRPIIPEASRKQEENGPMMPLRSEAENRNILSNKQENVKEIRKEKYKLGDLKVKKARDLYKDNKENAQQSPSIENLSMKLFLNQQMPSERSDKGVPRSIQQKRLDPIVIMNTMNTIESECRTKKFRVSKLL